MVSCISSADRRLWIRVGPSVSDLFGGAVDVVRFADIFFHAFALAAEKFIWIPEAYPVPTQACTTSAAYRRAMGLFCAFVQMASDVNTSLRPKGL